MTELFDHFHFIRPGWLLLIPLILVLWWFRQRLSDPLRGWREQIAPELLEALAIRQETGLNYSAFLLPATWLLAILAIAGPTWKLEPSPFADDASPLMIVLKADISMDQPDPAPSRLERAHLKIADIATARKGQPLGLIVYAGSAHLVLPPTRDTSTVTSMAAEIRPDVMPLPGDRLDLALLAASRVLGEGTQGSIVVIADSVETDSASLQNLHKNLSLPLLFLAINTPESSQDVSLRAAAHSLGAPVEPFSPEGKDVPTIIRWAANTPMVQAGSESGRWHEAGYWLVPLVACMVLASFRRKES